MKTCTEPGCNNSQFGGEYCAYHQFKRKMRGGDKYKEKQAIKKQNPIPPKSKKHKVEEKRYTEVCRELEQELRELDPHGRIFDFFSGDEIKGQISWHHLRKRGVNLKEKKYLVPSINDNHLDYHFLPYEKLSKKTWYNDFMTRLKGKDIETYNKEIRRGEKSHKLNPTIFKEEEL